MKQPSFPDGNILPLNFFFEYGLKTEVSYKEEENEYHLQFSHLLYAIRMEPYLFYTFLRFQVIPILHVSEVSGCTGFTHF